jgi:hypothetical protein
MSHTPSAAELWGEARSLLHTFPIDRERLHAIYVSFEPPRRAQLVDYICGHYGLDASLDFEQILWSLRRAAALLWPRGTLRLLDEHREMRTDAADYLEWANDALVDGFDSESLVALVVAESPYRADARPLFEDALDELGVLELEDARLRRWRVDASIAELAAGGEVTDPWTLELLVELDGLDDEVRRQWQGYLWSDEQYSLLGDEQRPLEELVDAWTRRWR